MAGLETKPLRFGFILLILGENDINIENIYLVLSRIEVIASVGLPSRCMFCCMFYVPTNASSTVSENDSHVSISSKVCISTGSSLLDTIFFIFSNIQA